MKRIYSYKGDKYLIKAFSEYLDDLGFDGENRGMSRTWNGKPKEGNPNFINVYPDKEKYIIHDFPHRNPYKSLNEKWDKCKYESNTASFPVTKDVEGICK